MQVLHKEVGSDYAMSVIEGDSGLEYTVIIEPDDYDACNCGCPDHSYRHHLCKHLRFFLDYLCMIYPAMWIDHFRRLHEEDKWRKQQKRKESDSSVDQESQAPLRQSIL